MENAQKIDFKSLNRRLTAFAVRLFAEHGISGDVIPGTGISAEDLAAKILLEYCEGTIKHHSSRGDLITLLCTAIRNDFYDALRKASHQKERVPDTTASTNDYDQPGEKALETYTDPNPADPVVGLDERRYEEHVLKLFDDEPELRDVCEVIFYLEVYKPSDIAEQLGISVSEFHNRRKRLRTRLIKYGIIKVNKNGKEVKSS